MRRRSLILCLAAAAAVAAWYWFRPELLFVNAAVNEGLSTSAGEPPAVLARGEFHGVAHDGTGAATVYRLADGRRLLRLTDFATSNGPALSVYLVAAADARDSATVAGADVIDLGRLKGNVGDQNYELPAGADLATYRAVTVWCRRFSVNFATAPLAPAP
jgi:hypothetical protein